MSIGIVVFPGSNCDRDMRWALEGCLGLSTRFLWHEETDLSGITAVVLPGGFSYGDYLRCGAIARFAPVLEQVQAFAAQGGPVLGICNGFQVLTEMGLLPGALTRNQHLHFICEPCELIVQPGACSWLQGYSRGERLTFPIAHGEGRYQADADTLKQLQDQGQIVLRYASNPNGSADGIAGICNKNGNVLGLMPHPERACDPALGGSDGRRLLQSLLAVVT
ncbi:MAG: phosphoribosylformylglycinamidine synthase subunit PurQ [Cyanobacteria bacterium K_DeepCast_35m_m2_155]|nr:phosphoribosylformylglycinamidine synthase subunit PurQ [Cyanobacteria bacterium K_DeepCast_35m_m2_155]